MGVEAILAKAATDIVEHWEIEATYTPVSGAPVACYLLRVKSIDMNPDGFGALTWEPREEFEGLVSVLGQPAKGSTFLIGSTTYTVTEITGNDGRFVRMAVK